MPSITRFAMLEFLCQEFSDLQPSADLVHVLLRCGDAALAFLLETVKNKGYPDLAVFEPSEPA